jgi:hypothetical protein
MLEKHKALYEFELVEFDAKPNPYKYVVKKLLTLEDAHALNASFISNFQRQRYINIDEWVNKGNIKNV